MFGGVVMLFDFNVVFVVIVVVFNNGVVMNLNMWMNLVVNMFKG